ncbi:MAG TPA: hypothetical protein VHZ97_11110 [Pseudonocardiaceae bacterium]|jgi:hypothetical protein|nr:hypothetical protein [Pseudonocardiaceae bacterium]
MRSRLHVAMALPATAVLLALLAAPALADTPSTYPTTPVPSTPSGEPPTSPPAGPQPLGHAVGDAATGLAVVQLLPGAVPATVILPGASSEIPKQALAQLGFGLSSAQANSESFLNYEHAIAQSCPAGVAIEGNEPQAPGCLDQTALPGNPQGITGGLNLPSNPLVDLGVLNGAVHANWSDTLGPCVGTIADSSTSLASASLLNVIPTTGSPSLSNASSIASLLDLSKLNPGQQQAMQSDQSNGFGGITGSLSSLGGLLPAGGSGSLVSLPNTLSTRSVVSLVDIPGSANKAVRSVSTLQVASVKLLAGTAYELDVNVVSQPTLTVTSTGDASTSSISYTAPVIQVVQGGKTLYTLDATNPTADIPIGIPLPNIVSTLPDALKNLPVVGLLPGTNASQTSAATLDVGVLRLSVAGLNKSSQALTGGQNGAPFTGYQLGATANMMDLQVLPTAALNLPNLPTALATVSLGQQVARAYAPAGGVRCGTTSVVAPGTPPGAPGTPKTLAWTNAAYDAVPLFWLGTVLLLAGVVLVAALPAVGRGQRRGGHLPS